MMISFFKRISQTKQPENIHFTDFLDKIRSGEWQDSVLKVRAEKDEDKRKELKKNVPYVTISGTFSERNSKGLIEHSRLLAIDFDDIDVPKVRAIMEADPYTYAGFVSVGGYGYCAVVEIDPNKHYEAFEGLEAYYYNRYNLIADTACKDLARARFVSYDPDVFCNPKGKKFTEYLPKQKAKAKIPDVIVSRSDINELLKRIIDNRVDITGSYQQWLQIGFSIESEFGSEGLDFFKSVSQFSELYSDTACEKQYRNCCKSRGRGITIATLVYYARQAGIETVSRETRKIITQAKQAKRNNRSVDSAAQILEQFDEIPKAVSLPIIEKVFQKNVDTRLENELPIIEQLEVFLYSEYPTMRRNVITRYLEFNGQQVDQKTLNSIFIQCRKVIGDEVKYELLDRLIFSEFTQDYNPFLDFFEKYLYRHPTGLIDKLCKTIASNTGLKAEGYYMDYVSNFLKKWLVGIVSAAHGNHSPLVLVLTGGQGTGKTEWFRRLLPPELQKYYAESKLDAGKDDDILMTQKLVIMDDEMGGKSKKEAKRLKELTSKQVFSLREPYGKNNVDLKRMAVLCGTSNDNQILSDPTGNRRVIPIEVLSIDHPLYNKIDKTDLFMEAYHLWRSGFDWQLSSAEVAKLGANTSEFEETDIERELIIKYYGNPKDALSTAIPVANLTITDIKAYLEKASQQRLDKKKIKMAMENEGHEYKKIRIGHNSMKQSWGFQVIEL